MFSAFKGLLNGGYVYEHTTRKYQTSYSVKQIGAKDDVHISSEEFKELCLHGLIMCKKEIYFEDDGTYVREYYLRTSDSDNEDIEHRLHKA